MGKFVLGMIAAALLAAGLTVPTKKDGEATLKSELMRLLQEEDLGDHDTGSAALLALCKLRSDDCYDLVRRRIDTHYEHRWVYAVYEVEGFGREARCYGLYGRYLCPGGLQEK